MSLSAASAAYFETVGLNEEGNPPPEAIGPIIGFTVAMVVANVGVLVAASKQMKVNSKARMRIGETSNGHDAPSIQLN